jgi:hypothetical protein
MKNKFDHLILGLLVGLISPTIGIFIFFLSKFSESNFSEFITVSIQEKMLSPLLSLCAVINLAAFYSFIQFDKLQTGKGIILATFIYGLAIVLLKFGIVSL